MTNPFFLNPALEGRYRIERELGAGGMATVWLAHDVRHDRRVALKVLRPELGAVLGVERFLAEIKVTANLQHPNLLPLFDSGAADGQLFYVMPYVEGESLRARLDRERQLPVEEVLRIGSAVASALDYAHRRGVIHRDLKPENILLHDGQPLLADFGIALAVSNAGGSRVTQTGLSLGTPQYMSPEQATGDRAIDGRTDIYSLGAVLYEALTGEPPHTGSTSQSIIARLLTENVRPIRASRPSVPPHVEAAVACALAKRPADRVGSARDFADALTGVRPVSIPTVPTPATAAADRTLTGAPAGSRRRPIGLYGALVALAAVAAWGWLRPTGRTATAPIRFPLTVTDSAPLRVDLTGANLGISPDGRRIVYLGGLPTARLFLRDLNELEAKPIPGTEGAVAPRFSSDGGWLVFIQDNRLKRIPLGGWSPATIADNVSRYAIGDNNVVVFARNRGPLFRVSAGGGPVVPVTTLDTTRLETAHTWPEILPGGNAVLFTIISDSSPGPELAAARLDDGRIVRFAIHGPNPRYVGTGHVLLGSVDDGSVSAAAFDPKTLRLTGPVVTVLEGILVKAGGATEMTVSTSGTLVYVEVTGSEMVRVDRYGAARPVLRGPGRYASPRLSPDGKRIALGIRERGGTSDVWIFDPGSETLSRFTRDGNSTSPVWTSDGHRIAWLFSATRQETQAAGRSEIRWQPWDGTGAHQVLLDSLRNPRSIDIASGVDVLVAGGAPGLFVASTGNVTSQQVLDRAGQGNILQPELSPDGRWLAYRSTQSDARDVYVTSLLHGGRHQVSVNGGAEPAWSQDGRTLYYRSPTHMMAASISIDSTFSLTRRDTLFADVFLRGVERSNYDVVENGREFLMIRRSQEQQRAVVVVGWLDELRERMRAADAR